MTSRLLPDRTEYPAPAPQEPAHSSDAAQTPQSPLSPSPDPTTSPDTSGSSQAYRTSQNQTQNAPPPAPAAQPPIPGNSARAAAGSPKAQQPCTDKTPYPPSNRRAG